MSSPSSSRLGLGEFSLEERESLLLAPFAMHSADSAGRRYPEPPHRYRGPFQRDRDRIVHSAAYRRLSHKTQVFTQEMGDYHRTRLTHTLEVASIARTLARALRLNEDLAEALALAHDIGHPPFGHAGEDVLDECLANEGGFNHNRQALRIVEVLEVRYQAFPGLNLSIETLDGQAARCAKQRRANSPLLETQVVDAADSIAYDTHDADDALESGLVRLEELLELPVWKEAVRRVRQRQGESSEGELRRAVIHELIDWQVGDLLEQAGGRLAAGLLDSVAAVQAAEPVVVPSSDLARQKKELEDFLHDRVYRHAAVMAQRTQAQQALRRLFEGYLQRPDLLPPKFRQRAEQDGLRRSVGDYLAGMTDRFTFQEYQRLFAE